MFGLKIDTMQKPWEGRFKEATDEFVERFTQSVSFDKRLAIHDIEGSIAHVETLLRAGVLTLEEASQIINGLLSIREDIIRGSFEFRMEDEDVHMSIEKELIRRIGGVGGKVHTGRSRNDQIATDEKLYIKDEIRAVLESLRGLRRALVKLALNTVDVLAPSYTHLQKAQPIRLAHYFMAYREMFLSDAERFFNAYRLADRLPLGSGAVAGVDFPVDRFYTARRLGFSRLVRNSIYATADRDFITDVLYACASVLMHLSRLSEDLILWSTEEFNFVELPDKLCTGSSIMPQKKNPDVLELIRGKSARVYSDLMALLVLQKGLPTAYNRDLQEDKEPLFDGLDTVRMSLEGMTLVLENMRIKEENMSSRAGGFSLMTDLANYLVQKGMPFRDAHKVAGRITSYLMEKDRSPESLSLEELRSFSELYDEQALTLLDPRASVDRRKSFGGTAKEDLIKRIEVALREEGL